MEFSAQDIIKKIDDFYNEVNKKTRYKSWEHCYYCFYWARGEEKDYDYLALQLAFYLASWGMYRGSSFLIYYDYKIHVDAVKIILNKKYDVLCGISCSDLSISKNLDLLFDLVDELRNYYDDKRTVYYNKTENKNNNPVKELSSTLISKILLGTLGCVPAYDRFFINAIKKYNVSTGIFNKKSLEKIIQFYNDNDTLFKECKNKFLINDIIQYPDMKLIDMGFWQLGYEISNISLLEKTSQ